MSLSLIPNTGENREDCPYFVRIDLSNRVVKPHTVFNVPITAQVVEEPNRRPRYLYHLEICGYYLGAPDLDQLMDQINRLMADLINLARLPTYVFIARPSNQLYPVYTLDDEVVVAMPDGPFFKHVELASVRRNLSDYLHTVRVLKNDTLHVRGVRTKDLSLTRPIFYLKKRIPGENEFWAPVFVASDGQKIYTYAVNKRRETLITDGQEALILREIVANALMSDQRLKHTYDLRLDRLMADPWERLRSTMIKVPSRLQIRTPIKKISSHELEVYKNGMAYVAIEARLSENRFGIFLGSGLDDLKKRLVTDYLRRGIIHGADSVRIKER